MFSIYCKACCHQVAEENLHDGRCPTCGLRIGIPDSLNIKTNRSYDVTVVYVTSSGEQIVQDIDDVPEAYFNRMKYVSSNVKSVTVRKENIDERM